MTDQTIPVDKLRAVLDGEGSAADKIQAIYDDLLPPTLPDPLFGARATHPKLGEGIVASHHPHMDGEVFFFFPDEVTADGTNYQWVGHSTLTFHTPETPDHPVFLETEDDYRNAPEGTVIAQDGGKPYVLVDELWRNTGTWTLAHNEMAGLRRRVLRWRWEA